MQNISHNFSFIPVLDLKNGICVHAIKGERNCYSAVQSPLVAGADPADVARALVRITGRNPLYIADLDAIGETGNNRDAIKQIIDAVPNIPLWLDAGIRGAEEFDHLRHEYRADLVFASETLHSASTLGSLTAEERNNAILSLDFDQLGFRGDPDLLKRADLWPDRIILMALNKVGSVEGPDLKRLQGIVREAEYRNVYAAGGVRSVEDAIAAKTIGASGVLLATALHTKAITQTQIAALQQPGGD